MQMQFGQEGVCSSGKRKRHARGTAAHMKQQLASAQRRFAEHIGQQPVARRNVRFGRARNPNVPRHPGEREWIAA